MNRFGTPCIAWRLCRVLLRLFALSSIRRYCRAARKRHRANNGKSHARLQSATVSLSFPPLGAHYATSAVDWSSLLAVRAPFDCRTVVIPYTFNPQFYFKHTHTHAGTQSVDKLLFIVTTIAIVCHQLLLWNNSSTRPFGADRVATRRTYCYAPNGRVVFEPRKRQNSQIETIWIGRSPPPPVIVIRRVSPVHPTSSRAISNFQNSYLVSSPPFLCPFNRVCFPSTPNLKFRDLGIFFFSVPVTTLRPTNLFTDSGPKFSSGNTKKKKNTNESLAWGFVGIFATHIRRCWFCDVIRTNSEENKK